MDTAVTPPGPRVRLGRGGPAVAHYPPGATFGPRTLRDHEFVWLLTGSARWDGPGGPVELRPGVLLLARPGMRDEIRWDVRRTTSHAYVHFDVLARGDLGDPDRWPILREPGERSLTGALCHRLLELGRSSAPDRARRVCEVLPWLLTAFVRDADDQPGVPDDQLGPHLDALAHAIRADWRRHGVRAPALAELAGLVGVSAGHLSRLFHRRFGSGPVAALELVRLARAAMLVHRSNLGVAEIAAACGYVSPFHFSRRFARVYGVPPRDYRRLAAADPLEPVVRAGLLPFAHGLLFEDA